MIDCRQVGKSYGKLDVVKDLDVAFAAQKINAVIGANGSGKTTLLRLLARLEQPDSGEIRGVPERISYVFQDERLLPFLTARQNLSFVLETAYPDEGARAAVIDNYLTRAELKEFADYYPKNLSGGMRQRLSIARAFAYPSDLLLMDEPFKALDIKRTEALTRQIADLFAHCPRTVIFVTHSPGEALLLADQIFLMSSHPLRVKKIYDVAVPRDKRRLDSPQLSALNADIIANFEV